MDARVDDQPARAPHLVGQPAEVLVGRLVDPHDGAQPLGVESPPFAVAGERRAAAERRTLGPLERERRLEAVARRALVQRQRRERVERARRQVVGVHQARLEPAASAGVDRRERVGNGTDAVPAPRQEPDRLAELPVGLLRDVRRVRQQLARRLRVELRIGAQEVEELRHRPLEVRPLLGRLHLRLDARDFLQADLVDLLWPSGSAS